MADSTNPFAGLLAVTAAEKDDHDAAINDLIEKVFYITIDDKATERPSNSGVQLVYLEELAQALKPKVNIDLQVLENALFERLLLVDVESCVIPKNIKDYRPQVVQKQVFLYLLSSLQKLESYETNDSPFIKIAIQKMKRLIYINAVTALKQPSLYEEQNLPLQLFELLKCDSPDSHKFFEDVINELADDEGLNAQVIQLPETIKEMLKSVLHYIHSEISQSTLVNLPLYILPSVKLFAGNAHLAPLLMDVCEPRQPVRGRIYELTIIGGLLSLSVLPKSETAPHLYFLNPLDLAEVEMTEISLCSAASHLANEIHSIFLKLLKNSPEIKDRLLRWIGNCLTTNSARGRLWNVAAHSVLSNYVSDGFMVNLTAVLLHLCQPFCSLPKSKVASLKIDPTYPAVPMEECASKSVHLDSLQNETCLLPPREDLTRRPTADTYNFVTECFFMTHKCIDIGLRICRDKLERAAVDAGRLQDSLETDANKDLLVAAATRFTTLRCAMKEDDLVRNLMRLQSTTCYWLTQVALRDGSSTAAPASAPVPAPAPRSYAPLAPVHVRLPATTPPPDELRCIPEFIFENLKLTLVLMRVLSLVKRLGAELADLLPDIFTCVLVFMGDSGWINNPHLRASLADCLEEMLPVHPSDDDKNFDVQMARTIREKLFREHPHRLQVVPSLLELFVGIEITGQSVFEHKFNYRRPMYIIMDYLWTMDEHKDEFARLAREAESNMEAVHPPIFLRFVNLLINDAIFLLDEALGNMAQLRTMEIAEQSGAWNSLPAAERQQHAANRAHVALQVRFQNMLGRDTIGTLQRLTAHIPSLFCHATLVDRIAAMLNYFLAHLVGPNKKNFKVRNMSEYHFDPANTVLQICRMYVQLGKNERFCAAVSNDGRSYSAELFSSAEDVLARIGGGPLIGELQEVARRVARLAARRRRDEEVLADAPDDFLDPIMSTLMLDPVVLPSSRATVDRTTIARHLLSDQSDPFNRSPLSMDQVTSNTELKQRIHAWIEEKRANSTQNETN